LADGEDFKRVCEGIAFNTKISGGPDGVLAESVSKPTDGMRPDRMIAVVGRQVAMPAEAGGPRRPAGSDVPEAGGG
jgi:hypothetical protein